jgi:hypothetical protein
MNTPTKGDTMFIEIAEVGPMVFCTFAESCGEHPITHTNVFDGVAFCANCGDTDHALFKQNAN